LALPIRERESYYPQIIITIKLPITVYDFNSGKSESVILKNEKERLSEEEISRMVQEAEKFAAEDEAQRKRIEALNSLFSFVNGLKTQVNDQEGMGGKISSEDKRKLLDIVKETTDWVDSHGKLASTEDLEEKLAEGQGTVNPITAKLYNLDGSSPDPEVKAEMNHNHVEL
jgi:endoplasmic reticulum chaperone BiP